MKAPSVSRRIWLIVSTIAVIGGLFGYYFLVYMKIREIELEAKKFRALNQYAENIKNAYLERTKKLSKFNSSACTPKDSTKCIPIATIRIALKDSLIFRPPERLVQILSKKPDCVQSDMLRWTVENWSIERRKKFLGSLQIPDCISSDTLKRARIDVINPVVKQSEFSELLIEVNSTIERQTFANSIDPVILQSILTKDDAATKREVEFQVNNEDYVVFIHSFNLGGNPSRIFGFCLKKEFNSQVRSVDLVYVISASLFLILILLSMPLLKLWVMNEQERLQSVNVWFCGFSLVVGSSFLLLILLMTNDLVTTYKSFSRKDLGQDRSERIRVLSRKIEDNFIGELRSIFRETQESELSYSGLRSKNSNPKLYPNVFKNHSLEFRSYPYFNEILWINSDGTQDLIMANHSLNPEDVVNLSSRKYFSQPRNDSTWILPGSETQEKFALQSIHSYTTNRHEAGFGTRFKMADGSVRVVAIATKLHSVMDPLLPSGYQFIVLDQTGKVWFHSITDKNLNENLFDETGRDVELIAAVQGRSTATIDLNYDRTSHRAYIKPINNTELFLVVLHDDAYFSTPIVLTVGFAFSLVFLLFLIQGIHQLILVASTNRFSLLKVRRFFLAWMGPQKEKMHIYRAAVWIQLILLLPCAFCAFWLQSLPLVVCFITLPIMLTVYHYFSLERNYILSVQRERGTGPWKHPFLITSVLLVLLINFASLYVFGLNESVFPSIVQIAIVAFLLTGYALRIYIHRPFFNRLRRAYENLLRDVEQFLSLKATVLWIMFLVPWFGMRSISRSARDLMAFSGLSIDRLKVFETTYYAFVFLWLILASIIPTYYFYKVGYYEEGKVWMRYLELSAAQRQESRDIILQNELGNFGERLKEISALGNYILGPNEVMTPADSQILTSQASSIVMRNTLKAPPDTVEFVEAAEKTIHKLMFNSTPRLKGLAEKSRAMIFPHAGDGRWRSYEYGLATSLKYVTNKGETRYYLSELLPYRTLKGDYWILVAVVSILSTMMLYHTLRFCITHIFGLGLLSNDRYKSPRLRDGAKYFIVGLPHSGKTELLKTIKKIKRIDDEHAKEIDLNATSIEIKPDCQLVIANYFHLNVNNHESNLKKLEKLEAFNRRPDLIVVITSNLEPTSILDFYNKMANYYRDEKGDYELEGNFRKCKQAYRKWKHILGQYTVYYHPLKAQYQFKQTDISAELNHGDYLPQLYKDVKAPLETTRDSERMILQVENLSQLYYHALWNCLSPSEKFILHDLAKDGFVNMRNMKVIRALRQKGILVLNNSLHIMNKSFNNFILSIVDEDADIRNEEEIRKKGSWNTLHLILVITIVSIIAFLGIAQQQLFKSFEAILAAATALLPLLARFGGIFTGTKAKE